MSCVETLNNSSMDNGTMESNNIEIVKPVPWFISKQNNPDKQAYMKQYHNKPVEAINDLAIPAIYHVGEIIHSEDKPPQVRLQACQLVLNKVIGDKIEIHQSKQVVDINKLIDQAMALSQLSRQDISKSDNNGVIDITDNDE